MKRLLTILLILSSVASFSQSYQTFVKDSTIFRPQINSGAINYTRGVQYADTFRIVPRDTTWQPLRVGTATTPDGISLYMWDGTKWNGVSGGGGGSLTWQQTLDNGRFLDKNNNINADFNSITFDSVNIFSILSKHPSQPDNVSVFLTNNGFSADAFDGTNGAVISMSPTLNQWYTLFVDDTSYLSKITINKDYFKFSKETNGGVPFPSDVPINPKIIYPSDTLLTEPEFMYVSDNDTIKKYPYGGGGGSVNVYAPLVKSNDSISQRFNVNSYGATGNGVALYSVAMTSSDATLTSAEANFVSGDIGKTIVVVGASSSNQDLITTIASINSTTSVELSVPAATTVSGQLAVYGEDQTTFIQAAINACNSAGGGKVIIPNGIYVIAGALQTSVGGLNMNSQIYIPAPPSAIDSNRTHIIIEGETPPNYLQYNGLSSDNANTFKGTILVSISQSGGNGAAVIGTRGENTVWGDFNYTYLTVNNLTIKVLPNPAGDGVRMGGISYRYGASLTVDQVLVNSMGNPSLGVMPSSSGVIGGIETPENNSEPRNYITNSMVSGFPNGFILGEHVTIIESQAQVCYNGFRLKDGYHKSTGIRLGSFWCKNNIYVAATVANLSQWDIDLDVEWLDNGRWYATENTISDSANRLQGTLRYTIIESGVGFNNSKFVADGADNVTKISTSSGNYGINTISPTASLHVTGTGIFSDTLTATTMGDSDSSHRVASTAWVKRQGYGSGGGGITGSGVADKITYWTGTSSIDDAGTLNWDNTNSRLGIGSITPTHSFELDSAMAVGINTTSVANKGIKLWSSTDKTTNTSGMRMYMGSAANNYDGYIMVYPEATGTRTSFASNLHLNHTNTYVGFNGEVFAPAATFSGQVNTLLTLASSYMAASTYEPYAGNNNALNLAAFNVSNSSSADQVGIILAPQNQQTGTAQYHAVRIAPYYNTFSSSGAQTLFEVGERANATPTSTFTGLFSIDRAGLVNIVNTPSGAATDSILTIDGSGNVHKRNIYAVGYSEASIASSATPSPTGSARENWLDITALAAGATFAAPSGTAVNHNQLIIRVKDNGGAQTLAWNAIYRAGTNLALPTTTTVSKTMYIKFYYNDADSKWDLVSVLDGL